MISSRRSSGIPSGGLESEDAPVNAETSEDAGFQLVDLVHEEGDPEAVATSASPKVSIPPQRTTLGFSGQIVPRVWALSQPTAKRRQTASPY